MDFATPLGSKITNFATGLASLASPIAILSLTIIVLALMLSPAAREWAMENKSYAAPVLFGLVIIGLIPAFVAAVK